jgi:hypothetical protein
MLYTNGSTYAYIRKKKLKSHAMGFSVFVESQTPPRQCLQEKKNSAQAPKGSLYLAL